MPARIRDVMTSNPVCAKPGMSAREIVALFAERKISGAPVVGPDGKLVGVISRTDLFRKIGQGVPGNPASAAYLFDLLDDRVPSHPHPESLIVVGDFMSETVVTAGPDESVCEVAHRMAAQRVHRVVVVDEQRKPVGMVTSLDLLRVFPR